MNDRNSKYWQTLDKNSSCDFYGVTSKHKYNKNAHGDANTPSCIEGDMRTKKKLSKLDKNLKTKLDIDYIESLVSKVQQLKSRMVYLEHQFAPYDFSKKSEKLNSEVGDFQKYPSCKCEDDVSDSTCEDKRNSTIYNKVPTSTKKHFEHQRSIYTSNEQNPLFAPTIVRKDSNDKLNKTNVSIVMSMQSGAKDDFLITDRNGKVDPKQFQAAAEEFIQQAEELKTKITYILDCCGYNTPRSEFEPSAVPSEYSTSINSKKSRSKQSLPSRDSGANYNRTLETINDQYKEILSTLTSIDNNIKKFARFKVLRHLMSNSNTDLEKDDTPAKASVIHKSSSNKSVEFSGKQSTKEDKSPDRNRSSIKKKHKSCSRKDTKCNADRLEPIVMVYEPIEPQSCKESIQTEPCQTSCKHCQNSSSKGSKAKGKHDNSSQKHGFVVTYTPNISQDSKASIGSKKNKKTPCCFSF